MFPVALATNRLESNNRRVASNYAQKRGVDVRDIINNHCRNLVHTTPSAIGHEAQIAAGELNAIALVCTLRNDATPAAL